MNAITLIATILVGQSWTTYTSHPDKFTASFPSKVTTQSQKVNESGINVTTNIFFGTNNGKVCVLSATAFPAKMSAKDRKNLTAGIATGFFKTSGMEKVSESAVKYNSLSGRYYKLKRDAIQGALWIVDGGTIVYTLTAMNKSGNSADLEKKFFSSLKIAN